tara:strand:- start:405 stop:620 length:216 start_codon:yes stop_codon:yes gene_type:complete
MGRKSKIQLESEYKKARSNFLRCLNNLNKCHPNSKRYEGLRNKAMIAEEECHIINRKLHNWKQGDPDKLIL